MNILKIIEKGDVQILKLLLEDKPNILENAFIISKDKIIKIVSIRECEHVLSNTCDTGNEFIFANLMGLALYASGADVLTKDQINIAKYIVNTLPLTSRELLYAKFEDGQFIHPVLSALQIDDRISVLTYYVSRHGFPIKRDKNLLPAEFYCFSSVAHDSHYKPCSKDKLAHRNMYYKSGLQVHMKMNMYASFYDYGFINHTNETGEKIARMYYEAFSELMNKKITSYEASNILAFIDNDLAKHLLYPMSLGDSHVNYNFRHMVDNYIDRLNELSLCGSNDEISNDIKGFFENEVVANKMFGLFMGNTRLQLNGMPSKLSDCTQSIEENTYNLKS